MGQHDHKIGTLGPQLRHFALDRGQDGAHLQLAFKLRPRPPRHLRRGRAGHADPKRAYRAAVIHKISVQNGMARDQVAAIGQPPRIGQNHRVTRRGKQLVQHLEAEIEVMVAKRRGIVAQGIHRCDHRVHIAMRNQFRQGGIGQRRALERVAIVEQDGIGAFRPRLFDHRRKRRKPDPIIATIREIIERKQVRMQI